MDTRTVLRAETVTVRIEGATGNYLRETMYIYTKVQGRPENNRVRIVNQCEVLNMSWECKENCHAKCLVSWA